MHFGVRYACDDPIIIHWQKFVIVVIQANTASSKKLRDKYGPRTIGRAEPSRH
jgi:hypothetical protein